MKTLDLENMGLQNLSQSEMIEMEGGGFWDILGTIAGALAAIGLVVAAFGGGWAVFLAGAALIGVGGASAAVAQVLDPNGNEFGQFMNGLNEILPYAV